MSSFSTYIQFMLFSSFLWRIACLDKINTRVYKKLLPQYQTVQKCAVPTKPIFITWNKLKLGFLGGKGGSTSILDDAYHCKIDE